MAMDPIGTPRKRASAQQSITPLNGLGTGNGVWSNAGSRVGSGAATPIDRDQQSQDHLKRLWDRYTFCKNADSLKNNLLEEALSRYTNAMQQNDQLQQENESLKQAVGRTDGTDQTMEFQLKAYKEHSEKLFELLTRESYAAILINGDGMIFNSEFIRRGEEGGKAAAKQLLTSVAEWLRETPNVPAGTRFYARIYANATGLAQTCARAAIVSSPIIVQDFLRGLSLETRCDFIDVGSGKDGVDVKMNEAFKDHIHDYQCRHIVFGCSHGSGFARLLENYVHDNESLSKVTLLEGVPFEKELAGLPFAQKKFQGLFRDTKIVNQLDLMTNFPLARQDSRTHFNPNSAVFTPPSQTPAPPITPLFSPKTFAQARSDSSIRGDLTRTNSVSSVALSETPNGTSIGGGWANIARTSKNLPFKDLTKKEPELKSTGPVVLLNKAAQRIDKPMDYDHDKVYKLKQIKLCNQHYIGRGCCHHNAANHACPHRHDLNLSKDDLKWLRVVARETVCKKGTNCRELDCIYGHHCPYPKNMEGSMRGIGCINGDNCRFTRDMHGMDTKVARTLTKNDVEVEVEQYE